MYQKLFSIFISIALAISSGVMLSSCNTDNLIEATARPRIILDSETGIYTVKAGHELTISPEYENVGIYGNAEKSVYSWLLDGKLISSSPSITAVWDTVGEYYVTIKVTTDAGTASEEIKIEVIEPQAPVISLPISGDELTLAVGTRYMISPDISNQEIPDFSIRWSINGKTVSNENSYLFIAETVGDFDLSIEASNEDGTAIKHLTIKVLQTLPYELSFPTPSYFQTSTTRYTFANRPVYLTPLMSNLTGSSFEWTVNGTAVDCTESTYPFTPSEPGEYIVSLTVDTAAVASVTVICVDASEDSRYRKATAASQAASNKVYEWCPAPGQFIGETQTGGMTGNETTLEAANAWAENRLKNKQYVSLGGFGGYIVVGFDHSIPTSDSKYDFSVMANAFLNAATGTGGSNEPGIVYVMQDINGNGLPDDEWYELRGSDTNNGKTIQNYAVTYFRPPSPNINVQWTDILGNTGCIDYLSAYHRQDYYYPAWIPADSYTLRGTRLQAASVQDATTGMWDNFAFGWGYVDNIGADNLAGADSVTGSGQRNGFKISNAMYSDLSTIKLKYIDFIKIQTGVNSKAGWLGEVSTEVLHIVDLSIDK